MRFHLVTGTLPVVVFIAACASPPAQQKLDPERVFIKIDKHVSVVEPSPETGLTHEMLGMVRHPDGTIFLRTQTRDFLSTGDLGETWQRLPVDLTDAPERQILHGLGVSRDGRLWLMHQSRGGKDLFVSLSAPRGILAPWALRLRLRPAPLQPQPQSELPDFASQASLVVGNRHVSLGYPYPNLPLSHPYPTGDLSPLF